MIKNNLILNAIIIMVNFIFFIQNANSNELPSDDDINIEISNNVSEEYVTCTIFYAMIGTSANPTNDAEIIKKSEQTKNVSLDYAITAAKNGRTKEMAEKVTSSRLEMRAKSMLEKIDNDYRNISILINLYGGRCKNIIEAPDKLNKLGTLPYFLARH